MAFLKLPPSMFETLNPTVSVPWYSILFINLLAFPKPLWISIPECPPCNPLIAILKATVSVGVVSSW